MIGLERNDIWWQVAYDGTCIKQAKSMARSIVEYFGLDGGHRCGYCGNSDTNISHGMWAHQMTCKDYEKLMNRGWRRSGKYIYKPLMNATCCKAYTIRCDATNFKLSKSQKKTLKKMNKFLINGRGENKPSSSEDEMSDISRKSQSRLKNVELKDSSAQDSVKLLDSVCLDQVKAGAANEKRTGKETQQQQDRIREKNPKNKTTKDDDAKKKVNAGKSIEEFIENIPRPEFLAHHLEVKTVRTESNEFTETLQSEYELFVRYQVMIHKEDESENTIAQFKRFLVNCPLIEEAPTHGMPSTGLGAFHQQYFLDGKLIAVGVIDILPHCLSSKYFFYDPDFEFLSLGTYSALREIYFVRMLSKASPGFKFYYMGYYIHACQKMRYKGNYDPSFLLCPETFQFQPIKPCLQKLESNSYARLSNDEEADSYPDINKALVLHQRQAMPFFMYLEEFLQDEDDRKRSIAEMQEYCKLAGDVVHEMLLYRA